MAGTADRSGTPFIVIAVAITGLLSTVGAAALGGYWANESVKRQFESQRTAQIQDQRRAVYVLNQEGRVLLIASPNTRQSLEKLTDYVIRGEGCEFDRYIKLRSAFIEGAQLELE